MPEALTQYRDTSYSLANLVADIGRGAVALPDIQRPFVWNTTQVRNLFDSIYRGFPIGQVMFWETGADAETRLHRTRGEGRGATRSSSSMASSASRRRSPS
jgi:hypothetical protein